MARQENGGKVVSGENRLSPDTVRVRWRAVDAGDAGAIERWRALLDDAERARADRIQCAADRAAYVAAHALTRCLLSEVGGVPAPAWRFVAGAHGKPAIDPELGHPRLRFNMSHTRGLVAAAVAWSGALGIDVEALQRRRPPSAAVADRFFAPAEAAVVRAALHPDATRACFFAFWTLKEALIKATGEGLARPLDSFAFTLDPLGVAFDPPTADDPDLWRFAQLRPTDGHLLAIARRRDYPRPMRLDARPADP